MSLNRVFSFPVFCTFKVFVHKIFVSIGEEPFALTYREAVSLFRVVGNQKKIKSVETVLKNPRGLTLMHKGALIGLWLILPSK